MITIDAFTAVLQVIEQNANQTDLKPHRYAFKLSFVGVLVFERESRIRKVASDGALRQRRRVTSMERPLGLYMTHVSLNV